MADDTISRAAEILRGMKENQQGTRAQMEKERRDLITGIGRDIVAALKPLFERIAENSRINKDDFERAVSRIQVTTNTPSVNVPPIRVPEPRVTVNPPAVNVPEIKMPEEMNTRGSLRLLGWDDGMVNNPLPVQLRDTDGNPVKLFENLSQIVSGGGGGGPRYVRINNTSDDPVPISGNLSATLSADTGSGEIGGETLRMVMATDAIASVNIVSGSSSGTEYTDEDNDETPTGTVMMGDTGQETGNIMAVAVSSGVASSSVLRVVHATDVGVSIRTLTQLSDSMSVFGNDGSSNRALKTDTDGKLDVVATDLDIRDLTDASDAIRSYQVSGGNYSVEVTNEVDVRDLVDATDSVRAYQVSGGNYSVEVTNVGTHGSAGVADGPQVMAEGRTTNPTAVDDGDAVRLRADDTGRGINRPIQARDLVHTAYVTEDEVGEVTLLASSSGEFRDLIYVLAANESDAAINLDIRQSTGGTVQMSLSVPANATAGVAPPVPIPQDHADATWTVQNSASDNSNTNYSVTALFSEEV